MPSWAPAGSNKNQYGWALAGFFLVAGVAAVMGFLQSRSTSDRWSSGDQDVDSLAVLPLSEPPGSVRAPGGPLDGDAVSRSSPESLLQQAGAGGEGQDAASADGSPIAGENASGADGSGASDSVGGKPADPSGWNGEKAQGIPGTQVAMGPKPTLAPMSGLGGGGGGGGGGGSSGAGYSAGGSPFGSGASRPGHSHTLGLPGAPPDREGRSNTAGTRSIDALRQVAASGSSAKRATDAERAWGANAKNFDGASALPTLDTKGQPSGGGGGIGIGGNVPSNLKGGGPGANPGDTSSKNIQPPAPTNPKQVNTQQNQMGQMMMMMLVSTLMSGLVGAAVKSFF